MTIAVGGLMLVTQFILRLKEELRAAVEVQLPDSINKVATFAMVQEGVLDRAKKYVHKKSNTQSLLCRQQ